MSYTLLISNPPQPMVDAQVTASVLGLLPVDANLKARYSVPEIWLAEKDRAVIDDAASRLRAAGMSVVVLAGEQLVAVPSQLIVTSFTFEEKRLALRLPTANVNVAYDHPIVIVPCTPRPAEGPMPPLRTIAGVQVSDSSSFVDIYVKARHDWIRLAVYAELVDYAGLGEQKTASHARNLLLVCQMLQRRFVNAHYDDRIVNMQLRRRIGYGTPPQLKDARKGFSFASPGLDALLSALSPALQDVGQADFSSRLSFLTRLATAGGPAPSAATPT